LFFFLIYSDCDNYERNKIHLINKIDGMATNQPITQPLVAAAPAAPIATNNTTKPAAPIQAVKQGNIAAANNGSSSLNSISANNTPIGAANNFDKALNAEYKKEAGSNNKEAAQAGNNSAKLIQGLNTRVKNSEQVLSANNTNKPSSSSGEGGILDKITTFAKNAASNILPSGNRITKPARNIDAAELGDETGTGDDINIIANTENYVIILGVFLVIILIILIYFFSKTFNVSRTIDKMKMYQRYQKITGVDMSQQQATEPLYKFQIAGSYNACHSGNQMFSYTSELITKAALRSGARYLELNVFSSVYGPKGVPVVDSGYSNGEWKLMLNTTTFESVIRIISENAFQVASEEDGTPNNTDPLFIGLNLSTGGNTYCLDLMADILTDYFRDKLLDAKYAFQFDTDFAKTSLRELENKVVIFSSTGFEGSRLEELVNAVWYDELFDVSGINISSASSSSTEGFQSSNKNKKKSNSSIKKSKFSDASSDSLAALKKSLSNDTPASRAAVQSNKTGRTGGASDSQILSEKNRLTQNIKNLADELKESGLEVQDVDELEADLDMQEMQEMQEINNITKKTSESLADIPPSPTSLGIDQVIGSQSQGGSNNRATIMRVCAQKFDDLGFDSGRIKSHVANGGLCIVVPNMEGDFITRNYDSQRAFEMGCQFVAMNFQEIDENMDAYITRFESKAILPAN